MCGLPASAFLLNHFQMISDFRTDLEPQVEQAEAVILDILRPIVSVVRLKRIGPIGREKPSWSCWVVTDTDVERDLLMANNGLREELKNQAERNGFGPSGFIFQSEETVKRDYEGNWFYAMR